MHPCFPDWDEGKRSIISSCPTYRKGAFTMIKQYITDATRKCVQHTLADFGNINSLFLPTVKVNLKQERQSILGFGAAMTDASCYNLGRMPEQERQALIRELFGPEGLNLSVARLPLGSSDYACKCYCCDDTPEDLELKDFNIDYDRKNILPVLHQINEVRPDVFYFSSPWSPPAWMKTQNSMYGGWMREKYLEVFAEYYARFIEAYREEGIHIQALTPQNEPETDQCGASVASFLHPEFEQKLVRDFLIPKLRARGLDTRAWLLDHNFNMWNRAKWQLDDPATKAAVDGVAFHYYQGTAAMASYLHEAHPEVGIHWTEGGPDLYKTYGTNWCYWGRVFSEAAENWISSITAWNLALDEYGNPNIGPFRCAGLVTVKTDTCEVTRSGQYYALSHFSHFVQRGAKYVASSCSGVPYAYTGSDPKLFHAAFRNPDGSLVVTLTNPDKCVDITLEGCGKNYRVALPDDSMVTMVFEKEDLE